MKETTQPLGEDWSMALAMAAEDGRTPTRRAEITREIAAIVAEAGLQPGDRLPSERELARRLGAGRGVVRESLQHLAMFSLVEVRRGGGSYLRVALGGDAGSDRWGETWMNEHRGLVMETLEARMGLESFAARLAAKRAGPRDLERLVASMQAMRATLQEDPIDTTRFVDSDISFHDALMRASGNEVLRETLVGFAQKLLPERAVVTQIPGRARSTYQEHLAIYEAVRGGNPDAAATAMERHVDSVRGDILANLLDEPQPAPLDPAEPGAVVATEWRRSG